MENILKELVTYRTVTDNIAANEQAVQFIAERLKQTGLHGETFDWGGHPGLIATTRPTKKPRLLLAAHVDVVPAPEHLFTMQKRDGKYFGRGVLDMKCAIAAYLQAAERLQNHLDEYDFGILITSDEEIGGRDGTNGVVEFLKLGYEPACVVLPDGGQDWQLETKSNGYVHFSVEAHGKAGHGSRPWLGDNAAVKLIDALHELQNHFRDQGKTTDTINIGTMSCEGAVNRIPDYARADLTIRLTEPGGVGHYEALLAQLAQKYNVTCTNRTGWDPTYNSLDNPFVKAYADITQAVTGEKVTGFKSYAGSDARFFAARGIPYANAYPRGGGHHGDEEWIDTQALEQLGEIIYRYVERVAR